MKDRKPDSARPSHEAEKPRWKRPTIKRLGSLRERVLGGGKMGSNFDMDPHNSRKRGMG
jgi:hypothetical protein